METVMSVRIHSQSTGSAALLETFGMPGPLPRTTLAKYAKACLAVAAGDGELSEREMLWFVSTLRSFGADEQLVEECLKFDPTSAKVESYLDAETRPLARLILYDALRIARVDGVSAGEREFAEKAARALGVDAGVVPAIEGLLIVEQAVRTARMRVLSATD